MFSDLHRFIGRRWKANWLKVFGFDPKLNTGYLCKFADIEATPKTPD